MLQQPSPKRGTEGGSMGASESKPTKVDCVLGRTYALQQACSSTCGWGVRTYTTSTFVKTAAKNGGRPCPEVSEGKITQKCILEACPRPTAAATTLDLVSSVGPTTSVDQLEGGRGGLGGGAGAETV